MDVFSMADQIMTGGSIDALDEFTKREIQHIAPKTVVDFGAGQGKYGLLLRDLFGSGVRTLAVEAFPDSAKRLRQSGIYDDVVCQELESWCQENHSHYDLAIFGDVLEHIPRRASTRAVKHALTTFRHIIINLPLENVYQEALDENPYEIHRGYISPEDFDFDEVREKHIVTIADGYRKMNLWLRASQLSTSERLKQRLKFSLLRNFGRSARSLRVLR